MRITGICAEALKNSGAYTNASDREKERDIAILSGRFTNYSKRRGPRVGDLLRTPNGVTRFTYDWGDSIQTGGCECSFYLGENAISYSGGLDPAIPKNEIIRIPGRPLSTFWFFRNDRWAANNSVYFKIPVRIYERISKAALPFGIEEYTNHNGATRYIFKINGNASVNARGHMRQFKTVESAIKAQSRKDSACSQKLT